MVSKIFFNFHPYFGKWCKLTIFFQMGWNHQLDFCMSGTSSASFSNLSEKVMLQRNRLVLHNIQSSAQFNVPLWLTPGKKAFNEVATDLYCPLRRSYQTPFVRCDCTWVSLERALWWTAKWYLPHGWTWHYSFLLVVEHWVPRQHDARNQTVFFDKFSTKSYCELNAFCFHSAT